MLKRLIRYLCGTANLGLHFTQQKSKSQFYVYSDSNYAGEWKRRSTSGYLIYYRGNLISWCSQLQRTVASSSQEAEYRAINEASYEMLFLARLTEELLEPVHHLITVCEDNVSTISQCEKSSNKGRIKHIELAYYLIVKFFDGIFVCPVKLYIFYEQTLAL